ncbi:ABC transporter permease [Amnibacterium sp.]|uniref:ABC transporter permease n=1 Tax=Amnibacterium sp. TaxID=1872496 RepID=UPI0026231E6D|nr:ABC transporter permease [Amnibacterium sp.]MCU1474010.1 transporter permease [Amnibacterium sp.]
MFGTYLRRELANRRRQTIIIAIGMALAIALVILVNAAAAGVKAAQGTALQNVYGVGTDITVTKAASAAAANGGRQNFQFGSGSGSSSGGTQSISRSRLSTEPGTTVFAASAVTKAANATGVKAATGVLNLSNTTFTGQLPTQGAQSGGFGQRGSSATGPTGGPDGAGGSSFGVDRVTVLGYDVKGATIGPLTAATLTSGRSLTATDAGKDVAVLDADYATSASKKVGSTVSLGGKTFTVVGIVTSTAASGSSASNAYVPLDTAQTLAGDASKVSSVYVEATSASQIDTVKAELQKSLGSTMTVNTQADLASTVTGSLSTASSLANSLGLWLSVLVLAAAFLIAVLFTVSGVTRRTREFGTLKAIGWSNGRIVGQVAGESFVQGLIGGVIGIALGLVAILVVDLIHPTLTASAAAAGRGFAFGGGAGGAAGGGGTGEGFGAGGGFGQAAARTVTSASDIVLTLPITPSVIVIAVALAVLGGLIAGAFGGWRASRLRPAEALRSVA